MEIVKSGYTSYGITIRCHTKRSAEEKDYELFIEMMKRKGVIIHCIVYESDKCTTYHGVHVHGVVYIKKHFYRKGLQMVGYHIKLEEIYDWNGWMKYINKESEPREPVLESGEAEVVGEPYTPTEEDYDDFSEYIEYCQEESCCVNLFNALRDRKNNI